jgi:FkbM family methyltransferase
MVHKNRMLPKAAGLFEKLPRTMRRHRLMKAWMRLTREDPVQLVRIRDDALGYADLCDGFLRLIVIDGEFEKDFFRVADALLQQGGAFLDVGANHGLLSFGLARKLGDTVRFHMFEPNPKLLESIRKSLELYPSMVTEVNPVAVCEADSTVLFHVQEDQTGVSHIVKSGGIPVRSIKLDTYLKERSLDCVELLKLDIEGYELGALRGAEHALRNHCIKAVYFEYVEKFVRVAPPAKLVEFLDCLSYEVCFCRQCDIARQSVAPTLTVKDGLPGHGLPLLPIRGRKLPAETDLLALPRENLTRI